MIAKFGLSTFTTTSIANNRVQRSWLKNDQMTINKKIPRVAITAPKEIREHSTYEAADRLASRLTNYWKKLGFPLALFWADGLVIKSNLVNGVPPLTIAEANRRPK
jgi:hypothetical protein